MTLSSLSVKQRISRSLYKNTAGTVKEIGNITAVVNEINDIVSTIATAIEEQATTTREISGNVTQAFQGIGEVNESVSQSSRVAKDISGEISDVTCAAGEISDSSSQINSSATELQGLAERLNAVVRKFKY
jgi:methyl-accepting chemotaxis protein